MSVAHIEVRLPWEGKSFPKISGLDALGKPEPDIRIVFVVELRDPEGFNARI